MRTDLKLEMYEKKLEKISIEIDVLVGQITENIKNGKEVALEEINEQLREIQDFVNSQ